MPITTFAAIDVGSSALSMKIFQISKKYGTQELDHVKHTIELGSDTYKHGFISFHLVDELCTVLNSFNIKMKEYDVSDYSAYATSAIREASNSMLILDQIKLKTGLKVKILSNSEQRFLFYKALALKDDSFQKLIKEGTAIIDVGSGSTQISLYNEEELVVTQNIILGSLRIREILSVLRDKANSFNKLTEEFVVKDLRLFKNQFLKNIDIKNLIIVDETFTNAFQKQSIKSLEFIHKELFFEFYSNLLNSSVSEISKKYGLSYERASLASPAATIYKTFIDETNIDSIWYAGITLCDGIIADYAEKKEKIIPEHNFTNDILSAAKNIALRYQSNTKHTENVNYIALTIFDQLKKAHGLGKRESLLLEIAVTLHNIGEYINMMNVSETSYNIILSTEIIGLSHQERVLVANLVRYTITRFPNYSSLPYGFDRNSYIKVSKLTAILRIANAVDKSHRQKIAKIRLVQKEKQLQIIADTNADITLELGLFEPAANFFENVYGIRPILKQKRSI